MEITPGVATLLREMPDGYEQACFETGAIQRKRDIKNPDDLMMLNLFHLMTGCSLVEISAISKMSQIGDISDVAFMKRFKNCNNWFKPAFKKQSQHQNVEVFVWVSYNERFSSVYY